MFCVNNLVTNKNEDILYDEQGENVLFTTNENIIVMSKDICVALGEILNDKERKADLTIDLSGIESGMSYEDIDSYDDNLEIFVEEDSEGNPKQILMLQSTKDEEEQPVIIMKIWDAETKEVNSLTILDKE